MSNNLPNKLTDLNNHLFEQLERLQELELDSKDFDKELQRARTVTSVATAITNNANTIIHGAEVINEYGLKLDDGNGEALKLING